MIVKILPQEPKSHTADLPKSLLTQWTEYTRVCPVHESHVVTGSAMKYYCHTCGTWWDRAEANEDK